MLQRSAQEAGIDAGNLRNLQVPKLFPDYSWHSTGRQWNPEKTGGESQQPQRRPPTTVFLINKSREMHHRFQASPQYIRPTHEVDVVRYGKRPRLKPDLSVLEHMGSNLANPLYVPSELLKSTGLDLLSRKDLTGAQSLSQRTAILDELDTTEMKRRQEATVDAEADEDEVDDNSSDVQEHEEDEDEVADYTTNYYASEDESDGGGDGEATF